MSDLSWSGRASVRHFLQHHDSSNPCSSAYSSLEMPIHLVCSHIVQILQWTPRWLLFIAYAHTLHGYFQFLGPGLTSTSPRRISQMEIRERGALRCENLVMVAASQRCTFQLTGANRIEWGESPDMVTCGGSAWSDVVNRKTTKPARMADSWKLHFIANFSSYAYVDKWPI